MIGFIRRLPTLVRGYRGTFLVFAALFDGDDFGETALLEEQPRSATVRTLAPSVLLSLRHRSQARVA